MNKIAIALISSAFMLTSALTHACDYPAPPRDLPNGSSSTKEQMIAGVKKIAAYQENMTAYLACIEAEEDEAMQALGDDKKAINQRKTMFNKKYNAAVDEQTRTVEEFNVEIREFRAREN